MIQDVAVEQSEVTRDGAGLRVVSAVHQPTQSSVDHRPCTHRTWLEGDVQRALVEAPLTEKLGSITHREDLGVGDRVVGEFSFVVACSDHLASVHDDGTNGHVVVFERSSGLGECLHHRIQDLLVTIHAMPTIIAMMSVIRCDTTAPTFPLVGDQRSCEMARNCSTRM